MTAQSLAVVAEKGGVGKTTMILTLASALSRKGHSVLLIDADPQASLSQYFLGPEVVDRLHPSRTIAGLFDDQYEPAPEDVIGQTDAEGVFLAPTSDFMKEFNYPRPQTLGDAQFALAEFAEQVRGEFDWVLYDTPPDTGCLATWATLMAAANVLTPIVPEIFSAQSIAGVDRMLAVAQEANRGLRFLGYVVNMRQKLRTMHMANEERLRAIHGDRVLDTVLANLTAVAEAQGLRQSVFEYAPKSDAAAQAEALCEEVLARVDQINSKRKAA